MSIWIKILIVGLVIGFGGGSASMILGWTNGSDSLLLLSMGLALVGGILFWVGLIGFLVARFNS